MPSSVQQQFCLNLDDAPPTRHSSISHRRDGCVYCGAEATTKDHVPPRCLLEKPFPAALLTVPSCKDCNESYSLDEQYMQVVLAHIGVVPHLMNKVDQGGVVDRALVRAPALDERIIQSLDVTSDGRVLFKPEKERIQNVFRKIAFGLYIHRYSRHVTFDLFTPLAVYGSTEEIPRTLLAATHYSPGVRAKPWLIVQPGVFSYLFAKSWLANDPLLYCLIDLHRTLLGVLACPDPRTMPRA